MTYNIYVKLKNIFKLFTVFLGVQSVCPLAESKIAPNETLGRLDHILGVCTHSNEGGQLICQEVLNYFGVSDFESVSLLLLQRTDESGTIKSQIDQICKPQDIPSMCQRIQGFLIRDVDPLYQLPLFQLPAHLYCEMASRLTFIQGVQGENNRACWPVVMPNGVVKMAVLSDIEFRSRKTDENENGISMISISAYDSNGVALAKISVEVNQNGVAHNPTQLVWLRDYVTQDLFNDFNHSRPGMTPENQILMGGYVGECCLKDRNQSLIDQDPLGKFKFPYITYSETLFPVQHTLTHMLLVFTHLCQEQLGDQAHEISFNDVLSRDGATSKIMNRLMKGLTNSFNVPYEAWFTTRES
jgi:hypothetical protein